MAVILVSDLNTTKRTQKLNRDIILKNKADLQISVATPEDL